MKLRWLVLIVLAWVTPAMAQPANDGWANRSAIAVLPFAPPGLAVAAATSEPSDPLFGCKLSSNLAGARTVWYAYTSGVDTEYVNLAASGYDSVLAVFSGTPATGFEQVAGGCNDDGGSARGSRINGLRLEPQTAYSILVAAASDSVAATTLTFSMQGARGYVVTTTLDARNGFCSVPCTLRDAIDAANLDPGAVLVAPGTYVLTRSGSGENLNSTGDLDVTADIGIHAIGKGAVVIDGNGSDRVLHIDPADSGAHTVALSGLTLRNGNPGFGDGGAIFNDASSAVPTPTHDYVDLFRVVIDGNRSDLNGGGAALNGIALIVESTVAGNNAGSSGGGLSFAGPTAQALRWRVVRSTVSGNTSTTTAAGGGGGIRAVTLAGLLETSTVSANSAGRGGGGVLVTQQGSIAIVDSTITDNMAGTGGGGGGLRHEGVTVTLANSVLAGNMFGSGPVSFTQDCSTASTTQPFIGNFVTSETLCIFNGGSNNLVAAAGLGALADNGGPTLTQRPNPGSMLIDSGPATCLARDQRNKPRPQDGDATGAVVCDRGSFEVDLPIVDALFADGFEP